MLKAATPLALSPRTPKATSPAGRALIPPATDASKYEDGFMAATPTPLPAAAPTVMNAPAVSAMTPIPSTEADFMVSPRKRLRPSYRCDGPTLPGGLHWDLNWISIWRTACSERRNSRRLLLAETSRRDLARTHQLG